MAATTRTLAVFVLYSLCVLPGALAQTPGSAPGANENGTQTPGASTTAVTGVHNKTHRHATNPLNDPQFGRKTPSSGDEGTASSHGEDSNGGAAPR